MEQKFIAVGVISTVRLISLLEEYKKDGWRVVSIVSSSKCDSNMLEYVLVLEKQKVPTILESII